MMLTGLAATKLSRKWRKRTIASGTFGWPNAFDRCHCGIPRVAGVIRNRLHTTAYQSSMMQQDDGRLCSRPLATIPEAPRHISIWVRRSSRKAMKDHRGIRKRRISINAIRFTAPRMRYQDKQKK